MGCGFRSKALSIEDDMGRFFVSPHDDRKEGSCHAQSRVLVLDRTARGRCVFRSPVSPGCHASSSDCGRCCGTYLTLGHTQRFVNRLAADILQSRRSGGQGCEPCSPSAYRDRGRWPRRTRRHSRAPDGQHGLAPADLGIRAVWWYSSIPPPAGVTVGRPPFNPQPLSTAAWALSAMTGDSLGPNMLWTWTVPYTLFRR